MYVGSRFVVTQTDWAPDSSHYSPRPTPAPTLTLSLSLCVCLSASLYHSVWLLWFNFLPTIVVLIAALCLRHKSPINLILLIVFTLLQSFSIAFIGAGPASPCGRTCMCLCLFMRLFLSCTYVFLCVVPFSPDTFACMLARLRLPALFISLFLYR
jgi:hypothetical protein